MMSAAKVNELLNGMPACDDSEDELGEAAIRQEMPAGVATVNRCGPAVVCNVHAPDFRSVFERTMTPRADLVLKSEHNCQEGRATVCYMNTRAALDLHAEDARSEKRVSYVTVSTERPIGSAAALTLLLNLGALCSPTVLAADRDAAVAQAATFNGPGAKMILGDVRYNMLTYGNGKLGLRIKDWRSFNSGKLNMSDDE